MQIPSVVLYLLCLFAAVGAVRSDEDAENPWDEFAVFMAEDGEQSSGASTTLDGCRLSLGWPPQPTEVLGVASPIQSLNGNWRFRSSTPKDFRARADIDLSDWATVWVPGDFRMQGLDGGRVAYAKSFEVSADWAGERVKLRCHEIAAATEVWVNGQPVGRHVGHFIPFALDVTDHLRYGQQNQIVVVAHKSSLGREMSGYAVHVAGGITRKIELICVPSLHVAQLHATTDFDERYENATLHVITEIANESTDDVEHAVLALSLVDTDGQPAEYSPREVSIPSVKAGKRVRRRIVVQVQRPQSWNAEQPRLYRLTATLQRNGRNIEQIERRIGFREIEVDGDQLLVNGRPVKLRGVNRHLAHPLRGRSLTPELARQDAELLKAANCNFVRTSHYPPSEEFIAACDELGLYVEEEAPFCFFSERKPGMKQTDVTQYAVYANLKMVQRDLSHPSVVIWSIANESKWGPHFDAAAQAVARADPSRPRTFMWFNGQATSLTVAAEHYPGPDGVTRVERDRPTLFSEYCHLPAYVPHEMYTDPGVDDQWGQLLSTTWSNLHATPGALGGAIWCGVDDVFHFPPSDTDQARLVRGVAAWGLLDGWRRPKPEYWHTKKVYSPIRLDVASLKLPQQGEAIRIPVANRFNFLNLTDLKIQWQCGKAQGSITADVPPQGQGKLLINSDGLAAGETLQLRFFDRGDRIVDEFALPIAAVVETLQHDTTPANWTLEPSRDVFSICSHQTVVRIDRTTGKLVGTTINGQRVMKGGPHLAFIPTFSKHQQRAMKNETPQLTPIYSSAWKADSVTAEDTGKSVEVRFRGRYKEADLNGTYEFLPNGELVIHYEALLNRNIVQQDDVVEVAKADRESFQRTLLAFSGFQNDQTVLVRGKGPKDNPIPASTQSLAAVPRQLGLRFELPEDVNALAWKRKSQWTIYPKDHIGRPEGTALAFSPTGDTRESLGQQPSWNWSLSACPLGTRDFRSTKRNIYRASLTDAAGYGVKVMSDGTQHSRCYVHQGGVHWLIAELDNGPSETFMAGYFDPQRQSVPLNQPFHGVVRLRFTAPIPNANER